MQIFFGKIDLFAKFLRRVLARVGKRDLHRFFHHVAKVAGDDLFILTFHQQAFNVKHFAAVFRPGKPVYDTNSILQEGVGFGKFGNAEIFLDVFFVHEDFFIFFHHSNGGFAKDLADKLFQTAHARFAGVKTDDLVDGSVGDTHLLRREMIVIKLLGDQEFDRNKVFLLRKITAELNDLHSIQKGLGHRLQGVCRGDEHHLGQIEREVDIMVLISGVLRRIQNFQKRVRGVALVIGAKLVDLIQKEDGIGSPRVFDAGDDPTRHRTDVGTTVTPDLRFVVHAAQTCANVLSAKSPCDGSRDGGFAHARRPHQAKDVGHVAITEVMYGEILDDPILDVLNAVMVLFEDFARTLDVAVFLAELAPRQG